MICGKSEIAVQTPAANPMISIIFSSIQMDDEKTMPRPAEKNYRVPLARKKLKRSIVKPTPAQAAIKIKNGPQAEFTDRLLIPVYMIATIPARARPNTLKFFMDRRWLNFSHNVMKETMIYFLRFFMKLT